MTFVRSHWEFSVAESSIFHIAYDIMTLGGLFIISCNCSFHFFFLSISVRENNSSMRAHRAPILMKENLLLFNNECENIGKTRLINHVYCLSIAWKITTLIANLMQLNGTNWFIHFRFEKKKYRIFVFFHNVSDLKLSNLYVMLRLFFPLTKYSLRSLTCPTK